MSAPANICVFCGEPGATKSHIWPEWFKHILPRHSHHIDIEEEYYAYDPEAKPDRSSMKTKDGDAGSRKPRNTCFKCNNGWMRHLEEANISIANKLFTDSAHLFGTIEQRLFAGFACLITCRVAFTSRKTLAIPGRDRTHLKTTLEPPLSWNIGLARYHGSKEGEHWCRHHGIHVRLSGNEPGGPYKCNTQLTTYVFGRLCVNVFSSTAWSNFRGYRTFRFARIWPPHNLIIDWGDVSVIEDSQIEGLAASVADTTA
jgi:hypothetical protein